MRASAVLIVAFLLVISFPLTPARAGGRVFVDAGASQAVASGDDIAVAATVVRGHGSYSVAWTMDGGDASRFADPTALATTFSTAGLPAGDVVLRVTVTAEDGDQTSDTVRENVAAGPSFLVDQDIEIAYGVPDEVLGPPTLEQVDVAFGLPTAATRVVGTLSWPNDGVTDIDFELSSPDGGSTGAQGQTGSNPEVATYDNAPAGAWVAHVYPFLSYGTTARLRVEAVFPGAGLPSTQIRGSTYAGALDSFSLRADPEGGVAPYANAWDLDGNGIFETPGDVASFALPPGDHVVGLKTTDAQGYEVVASTPVHVWTRQHDVFLGCSEGTPYTSMEYGQTHGTCWIHDGHHSYFMRDQVFSFWGMRGTAFAVEQQLAPSIDAQLRFELSMDGKTWTEVGRGQYVMLPPASDPLAIPERQTVRFDIQGSGQPFRFARVHSPPSLTQGLSGYLDDSSLHVAADDVGLVPAPTLAPQTRALSCERDLMERFFETHPCWFGGIDRYDSASLYHTYFVGDGATLDSVRGSFTLAPFRTDDWFVGGPLAQATATKALLFTSVDGIHWTQQATIDATYGVPQDFDVSLGGQAARFVRLFPEYHAGFDDPNEPSLHHPRGYFLHSGVTLEGALPVA